MQAEWPGDEHRARSTSVHSARCYLESILTLPMSDRSETKDSFLGLYLPSDLKEKVRRQAEAEGVSISELVRRRLKEEPRQDRLAAA